MDLLITLQTRPILAHLNLRKLAVEYFFKNRDTVVKESDYVEKRQRLFEGDKDIDLLMQLLG
jgi:hypothetical protein